ncbi:hypothetical protein RAA17_09585 [Komagataeibacter rhaeticus]|nr:hypothetical protein [Komagataeibacter rhaeticus]
MIHSRDVAAAVLAQLPPPAAAPMSGCVTGCAIWGLASCATLHSRWTPRCSARGTRMPSSTT